MRAFYKLKAISLDPKTTHSFVFIFRIVAVDFGAICVDTVLRAGNSAVYFCFPTLTGPGLCGCGLCCRSTQETSAMWIVCSNRRYAAATTEHGVRAVCAGPDHFSETRRSTVLTFMGSVDGPRTKLSTMNRLKTTPAPLDEKLVHSGDSHIMITL